MRAFLVAGYEVVATAPPDEHVSQIEALGVRFVPLPMDNKGANPFSDSRLFLRLLLLLWRERPIVFLGYTVKPNVYGGTAARLLGIAAINNVAGLGTAFIRESWLTRVVETLYRIGLARARKVFVQNNDDKALLQERRLARSATIERLPGSGVDTKWFSPAAATDASVCPPPNQQAPKSSGDDGERSRRPFRFLLSARLLWDKGVGEFVEAARKLRKEGLPAEFQLLGFLDVKNRTAVSRLELEAWEREGLVRYLGRMNDVRPMIAQADCVVLPSYREGLPRSLLEAASMSKPIITTNAVGCRDVVDDGVNGLVCAVRDSADLAEKMKCMMMLTDGQRAAMGRAGREKMIREFDESIVIRRYLEIIEEILGPG